MRVERLRIGAWTAMVGVAALAIGATHQSAETTEAAWTDTEHATTHLWYDGEPKDPETPVPEDSSESVDEQLVAEVNSLPGLQPTLTEGLSYKLISVTPLGGRTLDFCHEYSVTNAGDEALEWELSFDTSQAPLWGWAPYKSSTGEAQYSKGDPNKGAWTDDFNPETSIWSIRGQDFTGTDWGWLGDTRMIEPGQSRSLAYCTTSGSVPHPDVDPGLFTWNVEVQKRDWDAMLHATVQTPVKTYIPWTVTVDLSEIVCPDRLDDTVVRWWGGEDYVTPDPDSEHVFHYSLPRSADAHLIRDDAEFRSGIADIYIPNQNITNHLQPDC